MKVRWTDRTIATLNLFVSVIAIIVTALVTIYSVSPGANPPRQLTAEFIGPTDPLSDLADSPVGLSVEVKNSGKPLEKIILYRASLTNAGNTPIVPADFFGNIKIISSSPWAIVAIGRSNIAGPQTVAMDWTKMDDTEFSAPPTLLNPGDDIAVTVYLTASAETVKAMKFDGPAPIKWDLRVVSMPSVKLGLDSLHRFTQQGPIIVHIWGWGVPFILAIFSLFLWLHLSTLMQIKWARYSRVRFILLAILAAVLSITCAEAITTYIFGLYPGFDIPTDNWSNLPPIVLNFLMIAVLFALVVRRNLPKSG